MQSWDLLTRMVMKGRVARTVRLKEYRHTNIMRRRSWGDRWSQAQSCMSTMYHHIYSIVLVHILLTCRYTADYIKRKHCVWRKFLDNWVHRKCREERWTRASRWKFPSLQPVISARLGCHWTSVWWSCATILRCYVSKVTATSRPGPKLTLNVIARSITPPLPASSQRTS